MSIYPRIWKKDTGVSGRTALSLKCVLFMAYLALEKFGERPTFGRLLLDLRPTQDILGCFLLGVLGIFGCRFCFGFCFRWLRWRGSLARSRSSSSIYLLQTPNKAKTMWTLYILYNMLYRVCVCLLCCIYKHTLLAVFINSSAALCINKYREFFTICLLCYTFSKVGKSQYWLFFIIKGHHSILCYSLILSLNLSDLNSHTII